MSDINRKRPATDSLPADTPKRQPMAIHQPSNFYTPTAQFNPYYMGLPQSVPMYHSTPFMNLPQQGVQDENSAYSGMDFSCMQQQMVQPGLNSSYSSFGSSAHSNVTTPSTNDSGISHGSGCSPSLDLSFAPNPSTSEEKGEEALFHVPSRLNHIRKYKVTLSELQRRTSSPECLNSSILGTYLRLAKTKEVGKELREKLRLHGLEVTSGRRKGMNTTAFTCLVEEEAQRLGLDLKHIVREYFPAKPLSHLAYRRSTNQPFEERKRDLEGAVRILGELSSMLEEQQTPFQMRLQNNIICDPNVETAMNHFSLITHGFGMINQSTWSRAFENFAKHSLSLYLQHHPHSQIINA